MTCLILIPKKLEKMSVNISKLNSFLFRFDFFRLTIDHC